MIAEVAKRAHEIINCPNGCGPADQKTPLLTRGSRHVADRGQGGCTQSRHGEQLQRRSVDDPGVVHGGSECQRVEPRSHTRRSHVR